MTTITIDPRMHTVEFVSAESADQDHSGSHLHQDGRITFSVLPVIDREHRERIQEHLMPLMPDLACGDTTEASILIHYAAYEPPKITSTRKQQRRMAARTMRAAVTAWLAGGIDGDQLIAQVSTAAGSMTHTVSAREAQNAVDQGRAPYSLCGRYLGGDAGPHIPCPECAEIDAENDRNAAAFDLIMTGVK